MSMTKKHHSFYSLLSAVICFSILLLGGGARAGSMDGLLPPSSAVKNNTIKENVGPTYLQMTYPNLFRLAWSFNLYQPTDKDALDSYLMVTECNLYKKYYKNEFEWDKIRKAAIEYFQKYNKSKAAYYEYVQPLDLARYDPDLQGFPLEHADKYMLLKFLEMVNYEVGGTDCGKLAIDSKKYPGSAVVNIISPLSLTFIRVPKDVAEAYVNWRSTQGFVGDAARQAYIRYRVRIDNAVGISGVDRVHSYVFNGRLMRIDVFADKEMMMPLYNQIF